MLCKRWMEARRDTSTLGASPEPSCSSVCLHPTNDLTRSAHHLHRYLRSEGARKRLTLARGEGAATLQHKIRLQNRASEVGKAWYYQYARGSYVNGPAPLLKQMQNLTFVDLFCGGGFGARGAVRGGGIPLLGLDAWDLATKTYKANFPTAEVITERIECVDTGKVAYRFRPDVLLTSPECTAHSIARGSKPGLEKSRETAIGIVPWIESMKPRWVIVENVNRMKQWDRHDELLNTIEASGYTVSSLHLNSADFGSAQARKRMFLICDRLGTKVTREDLLDLGEVHCRTAEDIVDRGARIQFRQTL